MRPGGTGRRYGSGRCRITRRRLPVPVFLTGLVLTVVSTQAKPEAAPDVPQFRPAAFGESPRSLPALVRCPGTADVPVTASVLCRTVITPKGSAWPNRGYCFSTQDQVRYRRATEKAMAEAEFVPALVAGKPVAVTMIFRVAISHAGSTCEATAIPNPGLDDSASDAADVAPQRIDRQGGWFALRPRIELSPSDAPSTKGWLFLGSVGVAPDGSPGDATVELRQPSMSGSGVTTVMRYLKKSRFIPGHRGGQPVPMRYFHWVVAP